MAAPEPTTVREANRLLLELDQTDVFHTSSFDEPFEIVFEGEETRWFGTFLGDEAPRPGVLLARGLDGLRLFREWSEGTDPKDRMRRSVWYVAEIAPSDGVSPQDLALLRRAGVLSDEVADLRVYERGRSSVFPDRAQIRRLVTTLRALLVVAEDPALDPFRPRAPGTIPVLRITGDPRTPSVTASVEPERDPDGVARVEPRLGVPFAESESEPERWLVLVQPGAEVESELPSLLVLDRDGRQRVGRSDLARLDPDLVARTFLRGEWMNPAYGDPTSPPPIATDIAFSDAAAADLVRAPLSAIGVSVSVVDAGEARRETISILESENERLNAAVETSSDEALQALEDIATDADEWVAEQLETERLPDLAAEDTYYGPGAAQAAESHMDARTALHDWTAYRFRRRHGAPTSAERVLRREDDGLNPALAVMKARTAVAPSLWRVHAVDENGVVLAVTDVFDGTGSSTDVPHFSIRVAAGDILPLEIATFERRTIAWLTGPVLDAAQLPAALEVLGTGPSGPRPDPAAFGRLWSKFPPRPGNDRASFACDEDDDEDFDEEDADAECEDEHCESCGGHHHSDDGADEDPDTTHEDGPGAGRPPRAP